MHRHACLYPASRRLVETLAVAHLGILFKPSFECVGRKSHCVKVYIDEYGVRPDVAYGIAGCDECQSLGQHLVITLHANKHHCHV